MLKFLAMSDCILAFSQPVFVLAYADTPSSGAETQSDLARTQPKYSQKADPLLKNKNVKKIKIAS